MSYCIYLRKSRADSEAEARGEGETLARHKKALMEHAARAGLNIGRVYEEIVSGDTIASRPKMQQLLEDVQSGRWQGVLVMEVERLARGDTIDQGIVAQAFRYSNTRIVTPQKTYDPNNEMDEEYFEFSLFMSRREYKTIKRRLQAGRMASVKEGRYMGTRPVYGYKRAKLEGQKGWTLEIVPEHAAVVKMVFDWYVNGLNGQSMGTQTISNRLNDMGYRTDMGNLFTADYLRLMLKNPAYIGKVRWNQRTSVVTMENGRRKTTRQPSDAPILADGLHEPIVDEALFNRAAKIFQSRGKRPKSTMQAVSNPLAGLVKCGICGKAMVRKPSYNAFPDLLHCSTVRCPTTGIYVKSVEDGILNMLSKWTHGYAVTVSSQDAAVPDAAPDDGAREELIAQLDAAQKQLDRLHELLESGVYDEETFVDRRTVLRERMTSLRDSISELSDPAPSMEQQIIAALPEVRTVLAAYDASLSPEERNDLLRRVVDRAIYHKTRRCYRNDNPEDYLTLEVYPVFMGNSDSVR